jgi:hypothetical protein
MSINIISDMLNKPFAFAEAILEVQNIKATLSDGFLVFVWGGDGDLNKMLDSHLYF